MSETIGQIMNHILSATTKEEALERLAEYEKENPEFGRTNVRHMLGYYGDETITRFSEWLGFTSTGWWASLGLRK